MIQLHPLQDSSSLSKQFIDLIAVTLTVVLFYLAFPSSGYGFLSWFALIPVLLAIYFSDTKNAIKLALLTASLGWMASIWWVVIGLSKVTFSQYNIVLPLVFVFCVLSAIPYAIFAWCYHRYRWVNSIKGCLFAAIVFTVLINFLPHILPGNLAHSLYLSPKQIQLASIGGVPLLFLLIHFITFLLVSAIIHLAISPRKSLLIIGLASLLWLLNYAFGCYSIQQSHNKIKAPKITFKLIQPNFSVENRTREQWLQQSDILLNLLKNASDDHQNSIIVLPEIPMPISYQQDKELFSHLIFNNKVHRELVMASMLLSNNNSSYFNALEHISNNQQVETYKKQTLVPFAEYIPFEQQIPWLRSLFPNTPSYSAGKQNILFHTQINGTPIALVPLICYEAVFSDKVNQQIAHGGKIMINAVDDAWFGNTAGKDVHFALALFRTVEFSTPLVRVTNNGLSAVINSTGEILPESVILPNVAGYSSVIVSPKNTVTIFERYGFVLKYIMILFAIIIVLTSEFSLQNVKNNKRKI
jgi:apolipoprotein N-acyltransferase